MKIPWDNVMDSMDNDPKKSPNQCSGCLKVYSTRSALHRHIRYECGVERRFKCPVCHRPFRHKHHLRYHMNQHVKRNEMWDEKFFQPL
jgi:Zinc finger, C2H2 type.